MKAKFAFLAVAVIAICSAFNNNQTTYVYKVVGKTGGPAPIPIQYEVVLVDLTGQQGTGAGQWTCNTPITPDCVIMTNSNIPDGYIDAPSNTRPYFTDNFIPIDKVLIVTRGTFNLH